MEELRDITGYEGLYQVSNLGQIWSIRTGRFLRPGKNKWGYQFVNLHKDRKSKTRQVHRLVAEAFVGPMPEGKETHHIDSNNKNNRADNLCYVTKSENRKFSFSSGRLDFKGEGHPKSRLNDDIVRAIRIEYIPGNGNVLADKYGITNGMVHHILKGRAWAHVE